MIHLALTLAGAVLLLLLAFYTLLFALWLAVQLLALLTWPLRVVLEYRHAKRTVRSSHKNCPQRS